MSGVYLLSLPAVRRMVYEGAALAASKGNSAKAEELEQLADDTLGTK